MTLQLSDNAITTVGVRIFMSQGDRFSAHSEEVVESNLLQKAFKSPSDEVNSGVEGVAAMSKFCPMALKLSKYTNEHTSYK